MFANGTNVTQATTDMNGVATATMFTANTKAGGPYFVVASTLGPPPASFALTNSPGPATQMKANANTTPQSAAVGTPFSTPLSVTVADSVNNPIPGIVVTFTAGVQAGATGTFASGGSTTQATTDVNGVAAASAFTAGAVPGGPYTVTATATGLPPVNFSLTNVAPDLTIAKTHQGGAAGQFSQGQTGATYTILVGNSGQIASTGTVTVTDNIPSGLTLVSMAGAGWTCGKPVNPANVCTRTDPVAPSATYPAITVTANVASNAPAVVTNTAIVSGGGEVNTSNDTATDTTSVNPGPNAVSVTPSSGAGLTHTFSALYTDLNGASDLQVVYLDFGTAPFAAHSCIVAYIQTSNTLNLFNDAITALVSGTPITPGGTGTLSNSQCTLSGNGGAVTSAGNNLTVPFAITFAAGFTGVQNISGLAQSYNGASTGWETLGIWTPSLGPLSLSPSGGAGLMQTFTAVFADSNGAADLQVVYLTIGNSGGAAHHSCFVAYVQASASLYLFSDDNSSISEPITPGSSRTQSNSQCTLSGSGGAVITSGNTQTVPFALTFLPGFTGPMNVYALAQNYAGIQGGWQIVGTWTPAVGR